MVLIVLIGAVVMVRLVKSGNSLTPPRYFTTWRELRDALDAESRLLHKLLIAVLALAPFIRRGPWGVVVIFITGLCGAVVAMCGLQADILNALRPLLRDFYCFVLRLAGKVGQTCDLSATIEPKIGPTEAYLTSFDSGPLVRLPLSRQAA